MVKAVITAGSSGKRRSVIKASLVVLHGDAMSYLIHRRTQVLARFLAAFFSGLLVGGLASCSGGNSNSGAQPTLTLTPSSMQLTAGAAGSAGFPAADRTGARRRWYGDGHGVRTSCRGHDFPVDAVGHSGRRAAAYAYGGLVGDGYNRYGHVYCHRRTVRRLPRRLRSPFRQRRHSRTSRSASRRQR